MKTTIVVDKLPMLFPFIIKPNNIFTHKPNSLVLFPDEDINAFLLNVIDNQFVIQGEGYNIDNEYLEEFINEKIKEIPKDWCIIPSSSVKKIE